VQGQRGFSAIEVSVAAAITLLVGWQLLLMTHGMLLGAAHLDGRLRARSSADRLEERLSADAASAWSVFVPDTDVHGNANTDGHEVDFVTEDGAHHLLWWAYAYDAVRRGVTRYAYAPDATPSPGERFDDLLRLTARTHPITDLGKRDSGIYDPLFAVAAVPVVDVPFSWDPRALGGNRLVAVRIAANGVERTLLLAAATAPSHFTIIVKYTPPPAR